MKSLFLRKITHGLKQNDKEVTYQKLYKLQCAGQTVVVTHPVLPPLRPRNKSWRLRPFSEEASMGFSGSLCPHRHARPRKGLSGIGHRLLCPQCG